MTAASATPSVAASSSTDPDRKPTRSVAIVASPVAVAHLLDPCGLLAGAIERAQRRQPADDVEEVRGEQPQRLPAPVRLLLRVAADQPHEHGHERQGREQHERRRDVDRRDPRERRDGHDAGQHDLRQVPREVHLEAVHALNRGRRDLGARGAVARDRVPTQTLLDELEPQLGEHVRRCPPARHLEAPGEHGARGEHH